jgi:hypothetical protein
LGVTLAAAAASATLSINALSLALGSLGGTGRSLLSVCTADRPVGCDARRRSCVCNTLDQRRFAAPAASATLSINAASPQELRRQRSQSKLLLTLPEAWAA